MFTSLFLNPLQKKDSRLAVAVLMWLQCECPNPKLVLEVRWLIFVSDECLQIPMAPIRIVECNSGARVPTFYGNTPNYLSEDSTHNGWLADHGNAPLLHQQNRCLVWSLLKCTNRLRSHFHQKYPILRLNQGLWIQI